MHVLRSIQAGSLAPASFQRPYVWTQADVLALCHSLVKGYPIGGLLTWTPWPWSNADFSKVGRTRLGPIEVAQRNKYTSLLLDGQNRLASLAWFFREEDAPLPADMSEAEAATWGEQWLVANLHTRTFEFVPHSEREAGMRVPMRALVDSQYGNQVTRKRFDTLWACFSEEERNAGLVWRDQVADAFREAQVAHTHLDNATPEEAKDAFLHICRVGVPMSAEDFDKAIAWALEGQAGSA